MSLTANTGSHMGGVGMPMHMPQIPRAGGNFQAPQGQGPGPSQFQGLSADGNFESRVDRGALTGDKCLSFSISNCSANTAITAEWVEKDAEVRIETTSVSSKQVKRSEIAGSKAGKEIVEFVKSKIKRATESGEDAPPVSMKKKKKKQDYGYRNLSLSVPTTLGHSKLYEMIESIENEGFFKVKHIFNRPVSVVAGMAHRLFSSPTGPLHKKSNEGIDTDDRFLYVHFDDGGVVDEIALVSGEGKRLAADSGCTSGYSRFATLAARGYSASPDGGDNTDTGVFDPEFIAQDPLYRTSTFIIVDGLKAPTNTANTEAGNSLRMIKNIALSLEKGCSDGATDDQRNTNASGKVPYALAESADCSRGTCVLSAAELTSSKQYIQIEDSSWKLIFLLAFGDAYIGHHINVKIENPSAGLDVGKNQSSIVQDSVIFGPCRVPKKEMGPANSCPAVRQWQYTFNYGNTYQTRSTDLTGVGQRVSIIENGSEVVREFYPLHVTEPSDAGTSANTSDEKVSGGQRTSMSDDNISSEVTLVIWVDPAIGAVKYRLDRKQTVGDIKAAHRFYLYTLLGLVVFVILLLVFFYGESYWKASYVEADIKWLQEICRDKSGGSATDENGDDDSSTHQMLCQDTVKTIATFTKGEKMWLLHRKLQRSLGVKLSAPPSLGEL